MIESRLQRQLNYVIFAFNMNPSNIHSEESDNIYSQIKQVLLKARGNVLTTVNSAMVQAYWHIGKLIVETQGGEERSGYGDDLIARISKRLTDEIGKGFTATNLRYMRLFYLSFPIYHSVSDKLSWTHYRMLTKVSNPKARKYYAEEAVAGKWSVRQLERQ